MTLRPTSRLAKHLAFIQLDLMLAVSILMLLFIPFGVTSSGKLDLARRQHFEAVALQMIDGELDVLLAGERQKYLLGEHKITPPGEAVKTLPVGEFILIVKEKQLYLAWVPEKEAKWGRVEREVTLK